MSREPAHPIDISAFYCIAKSSEIAATPIRFSVSTLREIEACPKRWSLSNSSYSSIWNGIGYPRKPNLSALLGRITHQSLGVISGSFSTVPGCSVSDGSAINMMKKLGGITCVIEQCIQSEIDDLRKNPRALRGIDYIENCIRDNIPKVRDQLKKLLFQFPLVSPTQPKIKGFDSNSTETNGLGIGTYTEYRLEANDLGWVGIADVINIKGDSCEIIEVKTGNPAPWHNWQLRVYNLLWLRDKKSNPNLLPVEQLILLYDAGPVYVTPISEQDRVSFERDLMQRSAMASDSIQADSPSANLSDENCRYCNVRHLCEDYWNQSITNRTKELHKPPFPIDAQIRITEQSGPQSWVVEVESSTSLPFGCSVIVRLKNSLDHLGRVMKVGSRVRILDAYLTELSTESEAPSYSAYLTHFSEAFILQD